MEQVFQRSARHISGRIEQPGGSRVAQIDIQEGINQRFGQLLAVGDSLFNEEGIELTAFAEDFGPIGPRRKSTSVRFSLNQYSSINFGGSFWLKTAGAS